MVHTLDPAVSVCESNLAMLLMKRQLLNQRKSKLMRLTHVKIIIINSEGIMNWTGPVKRQREGEGGVRTVTQRNLQSETARQMF